jgi:hypothetical protein
VQKGAVTARGSILAAVSKQFVEHIRGVAAAEGVLAVVALAL